MLDQPIGFDPAQPVESDSPPQKFFSTIELLIAAGAVALLFTILVPNFMKARARGQLTACKSNLKNLATALEMYASDHKGRFPQRLNQLIQGHYLNKIPGCPSRSLWGHKLAGGDDYTYRATTTPATFSMCCQGDHARAYRGFDADPRFFPRYDSVTGLLDHP